MRFDDSNFPMVAKTFHGLEDVLVAELTDLGATEIKKLRRAVQFKGDTELLYKANLWLRTAVRILKPVHMFRVTNDKDLYLRTKEIDWDEIIDTNQTFSISSTVNSPHFNHANYVALKTKDAIVDKIRNKQGKRPSVDKVDPDIDLHVHISHEDCEIYLDSSGDSLHKRGWRVNQAEAPLSEILAAGMILLSGWDKKTDFFDPMCGSGTLPIEAAMIATNTAPGLKREFAFKKWSDFDPDLWQQIVADAESKIVEPLCKIYAKDILIKLSRMTRENVLSAGLADVIEVGRNDFFRKNEDSFEGMIIINPPYGERLEIDEIIEYYREIGDSLKQNYTNCTAWVLSSDKEAIKNVGLKPSKKMQLFNGKLECKYHRFDIY